ncbi:MAG: AAA family ATPase, partial [Malacoplasma sp.]|nr:AAA family ATPase [Malacoplasma sp.]
GRLKRIQMSVKVEKIYLQNYKLFTEKEIVINENLSVFDGPNGYGKTSIFDAIEFLITGEISRVKDNDSISGGISYDSNFLAKDSHKEVVIKGEFSKEGEENLIIALCIPAVSTFSKRTNNPKNIGASVKAYKLTNFELPESEWKSCSVEKFEIDKIREDYFGKQNIEHFSMIHYVHQEDRLAYFKKTESDRTEEIQKLFGIENEANKKQDIDVVCRKINRQLTVMDENINKLTEEVRAMPETRQSNVQYIDLLGGKVLWDKKEINFKGASSKGQFEECINQLSGIAALAEWKESFLLDRDLRFFEEVPTEKRMAAILTCLSDNRSPKYLEQLEVEYTNIIFLTEQLKKAEQSNFMELNYDKICDIINCPDLKILFKSLIEKIKIAKTSETDLQKSVSNLITLRKNLRKQIYSFDNWYGNKCPYCGQLWEDSNVLLTQFIETEKLISETIGRENATIGALLGELKKSYEKVCVVPITEYINERKDNVYFSLFREIGTLKTLRQLSYKCMPILHRISNEKKVPNDYKYILERINKFKAELPVEYEDTSNKYRFDILDNEYFKGNNYLDLLTKEKIDLKRLYLQNQYFNSFEKTIHELSALKEQREKLSQIYRELKSYGKALTDALYAYKEQVLGQIEIPFFLYSSRLLQSYQSGQGVMIKTNGKTIRFTSPGAEHDVLYTMSSGQLSAVLLSFSLALNKIYSGQSFKTLLIDDPVQCMDDINMVSFVELLRLEFKDTQVIISTHEDTFSNFVQYKYDKYNQKSESINLHGWFNWR